MFEKKVRINNCFKEWLGEDPTQGDMLLVFGTSILATALLITAYFDELRSLSLWKSVVFAVVSFDIIGGAVANFTISTDKYYARSNKKRWMFFAEHLFHFMLFYIAIGGTSWFWILIFAYTMVSAAIVNIISEKRVQEIIAPAFVTVGCILFYGFHFVIPLMSWFPAVLMIKIIIGFAVQRTNPSII
jgi:hypothetical protein